jgi:hypothetical protein
LYFSTDAPEKKSIRMSDKYIGKGEKHARIIVQSMSCSITSSATYFHLQETSNYMAISYEVIIIVK